VPGVRISELGEIDEQQWRELLAGEREPWGGLGEELIWRNSADQPTGRIEMPMVTMWRPLRDAAKWPPGRIDVRGLPF
jgi:hypothetical protein